jgi:hypothetical protein
VPDGLVSQRIDVTTGLLAPEGDTNVMNEWYFQDKLPTQGNASNTPTNDSSEPLF